MTDNQATPRFPIPEGFRLLQVGEVFCTGDFAVYKASKEFYKHEIESGIRGEVSVDNYNWYFRPVAVSKTEITTEGETLASSLVDVLSAENADLKAKLDTLQSLYDEAAQEDLMRMSREEALTAALAKAREALEAWTRHFEAVDRCRNGDNDGADIFEATEAYNLAVKLTPAALGGDL